MPDQHLTTVRGVSLPAAPWETPSAPPPPDPEVVRLDVERRRRERMRTRIAEMCDAGAKSAAIMAELGISRATLDNELRRMGKRLRTAKTRGTVAPKIARRREKVAELHAQDRTALEIADALQASYPAILSDHAALGLRPVDVRERAARPRRARVAELFAEGLGIVDISLRLGEPRETVRRDIKALGLKRPGRARR